MTVFVLSSFVLSKGFRGSTYNNFFCSKCGISVLSYGNHDNLIAVTAIMAGLEETLK